MVNTENKRQDQTLNAIETVLMRQFDRLGLVSVDAKGAFDHDGDPILRVIVVYEADKTSLEPSRLSGLVRHLRPALAEHGEDRFPVVSFIDAEESAEAA